MRLGLSLAVTQPQSGASFDPAAQAWATAVTAASGTYTAGDLTAMSTFIAGMKAAGLWTKVVGMAPMYGADLAAATVQYAGGSWAAATNHNFVSGDYSRATGLAGNGTTKWLESGILITAFTSNDTTLANYVRVNGANNSACMGVFDGVNSAYFTMYPTYGGTTIYSDQYDAGSELGVATASPAGLVSATRTGANVHKIYQGGVEIATSATASTKALTDIAAGAKFGWFGSTVAGTPGNITGAWDGTSGFMIAMTGTTAQNNADLYTLVQALMTAAGRNV
jgi:hypothetical protein